MPRESTEWHVAGGPLPTRWVADIDPENPWPEHPRPQLVRPVWRNLNGIYECAIRPADEAWPARFDRRILVPFPVESALSGVTQPLTSQERLWYRRVITVPAAPPGMTWLLHFGAVDWRADVYLDRRHLGSHSGGYDSFSFDVGPLGAEHELAVAVWDPTDDGPQPRGKQARRPPRVLRPFFYSPVSGIWQSVWLELVPQTHIAGLRLTSRRTTLQLAITLEGAQGGERLRATVSSNDGIVAHAEGHADIVLSIDVPDARRWSPNDPYLYDVTLEILRDGGVVDRATSYCGLRDIEVLPDAHGRLRLHLNGEPILAHGLLDQGYWPDGLYSAPTDAALRFDIEETKRLGFNLIRKHVKVEPARWYAHCDRVGLLVFQDMPNADRMTLGLPIGGLGWFDPTRWIGPRGIRKSPDAAVQFERELEAMVRLLGNHPCIVMWVPFNEGWGQYDAERIARRTTELDPTRLVDAASGWVDPGNGDVRDVHVYHPGPRMPAHPDPRRADVLGEWGGLGLDVAGHRWPRRPFAYKTMRDGATLEAAYIERLRTIERLVAQGLTAAVYTQTTDIEGEINGLLTYDREVLKVSADVLRREHQRLFDVARRATVDVTPARQARA